MIAIEDLWDAIFIGGWLTQGDGSTPLTGNDHVEFLTATAGGG
ncbi:hypothetical protein [Actinomadura litoris]|nr:hypothetical protein [Actinomadura litoris]